jgi:hypothetical protein
MLRRGVMASASAASQETLFPRPVHTTLALEKGICITHTSRRLMVGQTCWVLVKLESVIDLVLAGSARPGVCLIFLKACDFH